MRTDISPQSPRVAAQHSGLTSPLLPLRAGTPPPSAHSAGGEMTLPPAPTSEQPPAAQRSCNGAEGTWLWESRSSWHHFRTSHHALPCAQLKTGHIPSSSLLCGACSVAITSSILPSGRMMAPHRTDPSLQAAARNFQGVGSCLVLVPGTTDRDMYLQQRHNTHQHLCGPMESSPEPFPNTKSPLRPTGHCTPSITHEATLALSASAGPAAAQSTYSSGGPCSSQHPPTL